MVRNKQVCNRCGHQSHICPFCDRVDPTLGGMINNRHYCHTFVPPELGRTCYTEELYEQAFEHNGWTVT